MKLALVMMINDRDLPFLKLHLPVFKDSFDGLCCIADPTEGHTAIDYVKTLGAEMTFSRWQYDWGDFATKLFHFAELCGFEAAMRTDPDECLWPDAGQRVKELLEREATLLCFPRFEFWGDRLHYRADSWPDDQARAWRLNRGIIVGGKKHEGIDFAAHGLSEHSLDPDHRALRVREERLHLYHYGWSSATAIWNAMEKYQRQSQVAVGGPEEVNWPADQPIATKWNIPFNKPQPIPPDVCGIFAPFEE